MMTRKVVLVTALLFGAVRIHALSLLRTKTDVKEGMVVPWVKISEAVLKPSQNSFESSSFVIEDFKVEPFLLSMENNGAPPVEYQAIAMMLGFQTAPHLAGKWFDFFKVTPELLAEYDSRMQEQVRMKLAECERSARNECVKLCPQVDNPSDVLLMACWLYLLDPLSIQAALWKCQMNLFLEQRSCTTVRSHATEAQLILMHGLPLFIEDKDRHGRFCLGFLKNGDRTVFITLDINDITTPMTISLINAGSPMRKLAKTMEWRDDWRILYVPRIARTYNKSDRMHGLSAKEED